MKKKYNHLGKRRKKYPDNIVDGIITGIMENQKPRTIAEKYNVDVFLVYYYRKKIWKKD